MTQNIHPESGNVVFFILLAVVMIGLVTVAIRGTGDGGDIDNESLVISAAQVRQFSSDLEKGVAFIMREGISESQIRFASSSGGASDYGDITSTPARQVFHQQGGGVEYRAPPASISTAAQWEFYGNTHFPDVGTPNPELIALLPNVTKDFCDKINAMNSQTAQPSENGTCALHDTAMRFREGTLFQDGGANTLDEDPVTSFTAKPAMQACVQCGTAYHFYHVLLAR